MLFQRLYNWIKYKTLPTSFLFKNRLFIERDTKTKRIFTNLGLTFRNSKWSDYAMFNIKTQFKFNFFYIFIFLLFSFIFIVSCLYFNKYYMFYYSFNLVAFNLWFSSDSFDYYISFSAWLITLFFSNIVNTLHSYLFFNNFANKKTISHLTPYARKKTKHDEKFISQQSLNYLIYSWLNSNEVFFKINTISNLFENTTNVKWWSNNYPIFHSIYKINNYLIKSSFSFNRMVVNFNNSLELNTSNIEKSSTLLMLNNSTLYVSQLLWYFVKQTPNANSQINSLSTTPVTFDNYNGRNLQHLFLETHKYSSLLHFKVGEFYTNNLNGLNVINYIINFKELQFFTENISSQFLISKWNRWLYRYSILHRKILKNSHKLTIIKRLLNSGIYNLISNNNDIWKIKKINKLSIQNHLFKNYFLTPNYYINTNNTFASNNITILNSNLFLNKINNLNNYENSFLFFVKRFFFLNTLQTNNISVQKHPIFSNQNINIKNSNYEKKLTFYLTLLNYLLKSPFNWLTQYDLLTPLLNNDIDVYFNENNQTIKSFKDYFILNTDLDILSMNNLNILYSTTLPLKTTYNFNFYNYQKYNSSLNELVDLKFFDEENFELDLNSTIYTYSELETTLLYTYIHDFIILNQILFNKLYK